VSAASTLIEQLRRVGSDLPASLAEQIMELGHNATPLLLALFDSSSTTGGDEDACSECGVPHEHEWARLHAIDLLTETRDPGAIDPLLAILESASPDDSLYDKLVERLPYFGGAATEPILAALARTKDETATTEALCCILSALGARDERILRALLDLLTARPRAGAVYLSEYGDPAACPALLNGIVASIADGEAVSGRAALPDLVDAYTSLGGELPADIQAKVDALAER
jgi:hypothetical protein